jgi:hypothetical protein
LGNQNTDSQTASLSIVNNALRWQVSSKKTAMLSMTSPTLPITSNIDMEITLNFVDSSENVEYGVMFRRSTSGSYRFLIDRQNGKFQLSKYIGVGFDGENIVLIDWTQPKTPININSENKLRVRVVGNNIRLYINDNLVGDFFDSSFSSGTINVIGNFHEGEKLTLDVTNFKLLLVDP